MVEVRYTPNGNLSKFFFTLSHRRKLFKKRTSKIFSWSQSKGY